MRKPAKEPRENTAEDGTVHKAGTAPVGNRKKTLANAPKGENKKHNRTKLKSEAGSHAVNSKRFHEPVKAATLAWEIAELSRIKSDPVDPKLADIIGKKVDQLLVAPVFDADDVFAMACMAQRFSLGVAQALRGNETEYAVAAISHDLIRRTVIVLEHMTGVSSDAYLSNRDSTFN